MQLKGREGSEVQLSLTGYEHPDNTTDPWDSNSLLVAVRVVSPMGRWDVVDPCLTTWEAKALATWLLRATAVGTATGTSTFTSPNVTIDAKRVSGSPGWLTLNIALELEERPPWSLLTPDGILAVELTVQESQVLAAARELLRELGEFPQRGPDPTL